VTSVLIEHFRAPAGTRDARVLRYVRAQTLSELAGRTVWLGAQSAGAHRLREDLAWARGAGVASGWIGAQAPDDEDLSADVRPDDIVVLHDPLTSAPAEAIRQRGAHVILVRSAGAPTSAINAYVFSRATAAGAHLLAAVIPCAGIVAVKTVRGTDYRDIGWSSLLADVVARDRDECVGGTLHPRPSVAAR
jgi:hypothetical protein